MLSAQSLKELYLKLNSPTRLKTLLYFDQLTYNLNHLQMESSALEILLRSFTARKPKIEQWDDSRIRVLKENFLNSISVSLYNSMQHYIGKKFLGDDFVTPPLILMQKDEENSIDILDASFIKLSNKNDLLLKNLRYLNRHEIPWLQNICKNLPSLLNHHFGNIMPPQINSALISANNDTIYFISTCASLIKEAGVEVEKVIHDKAINFCSNFTIEITPNRIALLHYNIAVSKKLYPIFSEIFNSETLKKLLNELNLYVEVEASKYNTSCN